MEPPRGRGKDLLLFYRLFAQRITPAWAGKRPLPSSGDTREWDHPRVGGEKLMSATALWYAVGSPPRRRGKAGKNGGCDFGDRITPAWAGKRKVLFALARNMRNHPRVGGEKTFASRSIICMKGSPPRRRGKAFSVLRRQFRSRITPAWAGKSVTMGIMTAVCRDHPRVGGEKPLLM